MKKLTLRFIHSALVLLVGIFFGGFLNTEDSAQEVDPVLHQQYPFNTRHYWFYSFSQLRKYH